MIRNSLLNSYTELILRTRLCSSRSSIASWHMVTTCGVQSEKKWLKNVVMPSRKWYFLWDMSRIFISCFQQIYCWSSTMHQQTRQIEVNPVTSTWSPAPIEMMTLENKEQREESKKKRKRRRETLGISLMAINMTRYLVITRKKAKIRRSLPQLKSANTIQISVIDMYWSVSLFQWSNSAKTDTPYSILIKIGIWWIKKVMMRQRSSLVKDWTKSSGNDNAE